MWRLSGSDMFLLWKDVETRFGHGLARVEEMLVAMTGPGFEGYLPANQKVQDFCLPGLSSRPWFEREAFDWVPFVEAQAQAILEEFLVAGRHLSSLEFYLPRDGSVSRTSDPRLRPPEEGWQALFLCREWATTSPRWMRSSILAANDWTAVISSVGMGAGPRFAISRTRSSRRVPKPSFSFSTMPLRIRMKPASNSPASEASS